MREELEGGSEGELQVRQGYVMMMLGKARRIAYGQLGSLEQCKWLSAGTGMNLMKRDAMLQ